MNRICSICKQGFPATAEYFVVDKRNSNGLGASCRTCEKKRIQRYAELHPEKARKRQKKFEENNPGRMTELKRNWRHKNPGKVHEAKNRYEEANKEKVLEEGRQYRARNRDIIRERQRIRNRAKLEDFRRYNAKRKARKRNLPDTLTKEEWLVAREHWQGCCAYCTKQPESLTLDHFIPLVSPDCPGTVATNIVPACLSCNSSKNNADALYWITWKFGKERAQEIKSRISAYFENLMK